MYKLYLSLKYFRSRLINVIPVICMTLGVGALIVILAVMDGFQAQLRATLRGTLSDLIIHVRYDSDVEKWEKVLAGIEGIRSFSPHLQSFALVASDPPDLPGAPRARQRMGGAMVRGIDPAREAEVSSFRDYLRRRKKVPGRLPPDIRLSEEYCTPDPDRPLTVLSPRWFDKPGIILGRRLAEDLGVSEPWQRDGVWRYHRVNVTTIVRAEPGEKERYRAQHWTFWVTAIYESGNSDVDKYIAFMRREVAREFFEFSVDPQEIRIQLDDYESQKARVKEELTTRRAEIYAATATSPVPTPQTPYYVATWEEQRRNFLNAIENEKALIAIICGMAFIVTGFMIFSILSMIVTMKTRDIGILKALGATTGGISKIFVLNGLIVGVIGAALGTVLGLVFVGHINPIKEWLKSVFGWEPFPSDIYLFSEIPTRVIPEEVIVVVGAALLVALVGAILPALRASRLDPVKALRYE